MGVNTPAQESPIAALLAALLDHVAHQDTDTDTATDTATAGNDDVSKPRIIRHHMSGVWICYVVGVGDTPDSVKVHGRRVWSWRGGRLETSQLATQGVSKEDRLGDWVTCDIGQITEHLVDCIETTADLVEAARALPTWTTAD